MQALASDIRLISRRAHAVIAALALGTAFVFLHVSAAGIHPAALAAAFGDRDGLAWESRIVYVRLLPPDLSEIDQDVVTFPEGHPKIRRSNHAARRQAIVDMGEHAQSPRPAPPV